MSKIKNKQTNKPHHITKQEMKQLHNTLLSLLVEFDRICRKHDIPYSIDGGTLLGAVRHGGFIPWDDDADVILNRTAYNKLLKYLPSELDEKEFYFQDINSTPGYLWGYAKLRKSNTQCVRLNQDFWPYEQGVYLDIFVCDNVPQNYAARCLCNFNSFLLRKLFYSKLGRFEERNTIKRFVYRIMSLISEKRLKRIYNSYIHHRNKKPSNLVKCITYPAINKMYGYKKEWYEDVTDIDFEGVTLLGSRKRKEYLKFMYGDYMKIPPKSDRKVHPVSKFYIP